MMADYVISSASGGCAGARSQMYLSDRNRRRREEGYDRPRQLDLGLP